MTEAKRILVPSGMQTEMSRVLGYSRPTISRALNGAEDTCAAREIRSWAIEHGGAFANSSSYRKVDGKTWKQV